MSTRQALSSICLCGRLTDFHYSKPLTASPRDIFITGFIPQHSASDQHSYNAAPSVGFLFAQNKVYGRLMRIKREFNQQSDTFVWQFQDNQHSIDNTVSFHTLLRISTDSILDADDLSNLLRQCPLPSTQPFNLLDNFNWIIRAVDCLHDASLVALTPDREEGLTRLEEEIKALFIESASAVLNASGYPTILVSRACS